jgi:hypothetical protein
VEWGRHPVVPLQVGVPFMNESVGTVLLCAHHTVMTYSNRVLT